MQTLMSQKSQELQLDQQLDLMRRLFEQQSQGVRLTLRLFYTHFTNLFDSAQIENRRAQDAGTLQAIGS